MCTVCPNRTEVLARLLRGERRAVVRREALRALMISARMQPQRTELALGFFSVAEEANKKQPLFRYRKQKLPLTVHIPHAVAQRHSLTSSCARRIRMAAARAPFRPLAPQRTASQPH
jgi:hypothetical protein